MSLKRIASVVVCISTCVGATAGDPAGDVRAALERSVAANWSESSLSDILRQFAEQGQCNLFFDQRAFAEAGVNLDASIGVDLGETTWNQAMQFLLPAHGVSYYEERGVLHFTTVEAADLRLISKAYSIESIQTLIAAAPQIGTTLPASPRGAWSTAFQIDLPAANVDAVIGHVRSASLPADPSLLQLQQLAEALPGLMWESRDGEGGVLSRRGSILFVRQTAAGHAWIKELLEGLAKMTPPADERPACVDVVPESLRGTDDLAVRTRLAEVGTLVVEPGQTLAALLRKFRSEVEIPLWIDESALSDAGLTIEGELGVTVLRGLPWKESLASILRTQGLAAVVRHGHLVITSAENAEMQRLVRLYDIEGLHLDRRSLDLLVDQTDAAWECTDGEGGKLAVIDRRLLMVVHNEQVQQEIEQLLSDLRAATPAGTAAIKTRLLRFYRVPDPQQADELLKTLPALVDADWTTESAQKVGSTLAIRQTVEVHRKLELVLAALYQVSDEQKSNDPGKAQIQSLWAPVYAIGGGGFFNITPRPTLVPHTAPPVPPAPADTTPARRSRH